MCRGGLVCLRLMVVWLTALTLCGCETLMVRRSVDGAEGPELQPQRQQGRASIGVAARYAGGRKGRVHERFTIVLDPGHGGDDFGAIGAQGLLEKDIVLDVAFELERLLVKNLGFEVVLTRREDVSLPLAERTAIANDVEADLFISLHVNASPRRRGQGLEVYYLDNTDESSSIKLAERENSTSSAGDFPGDLEFMLSDLIQNAKMADSIMLAHTIGRSVYRRLSMRWRNVKYLGVKRAPFYVLVGAHMPCILVEMFFVDHPGDAAKLARVDFRRELAYGIYLGIVEYVRRRKTSVRI